MTLRSAPWALLLKWILLALAAIGVGHAAPVTFRFEPPANAAVGNPFARELWGEVETPSHHALLLPAFYEGNGNFAVRARGDELGVYRLVALHETMGGARTRLTGRIIGPAEVAVRNATTLPSIGRDPANGRGFLGSNGAPFVPVGANVAWAEGEPVSFYRNAFTRFGREGLNWMRIWMAHWGRLNLDWKSVKLGPSPAPGTLDPQVAESWDELLASAEQNHVYVQLVLQHHGQYSTRTNPNWPENPWNAANPGGFLKSPEDFFTSVEARRLTKAKYRYIVARWGWSPAIFAWELFNEVHWVDAMATREGEAKVGAWHTEMAAWLRSVDAYHHLVTTSTENLQSPCYATMDFYQPHLYPADLILAARQVALPHGVADRPVFYGEEGDDHLAVSDEVKKSGAAIIPAAWAGLFGVARLPAQPWLGADILRQNRTGELGALARFIAESGFGAQRDLQPFSAVVTSDARVSFALMGCAMWQRRAAPEIEVPLDGRVPVSFADVPRVYVAAARSEGFPSQGTYHFDAPRALTLQVNIAGAAKTCALEVLVDDRRVAARTWSDGAALPSREHPQSLDFSVSAGRHTLVLRNTGEKGTVEIPAIVFGTSVSQLAAVGQRGAGFMALWLWNRTDVYAKTPTAIAGTVAVDDVPAGTWQVTWWDTLAGRPASPTTVTHGGGTLELPTPPIARHAAVVLKKL